MAARGERGLEPRLHIAEFDFILFCFEVVSEKACEASMHSIDLLIFYCVSRSNLADLTSRPVQRCRSVGDVDVRRAIFRPIRPAKAPCTLPEPCRCSDDVLKNLWARCNCGTTPQRLGSICSSGVLLQCDVTRPSTLVNLWEQTFGEASHLLRACSRFQN